MTQALSWHWIFFINIPIGVATFIAGAVLIEENTGLGFRAGLDIGGAVLSTAGLMLAVYAIVSSSQYGWGLGPHPGLRCGRASWSSPAFFLLESRLATPMMPMPVMRSPGLLTSSLVRGLMVVGMYSTFFIGVLYFQHVLGYDPIRTGLAFLPQTLCVALMSAGLTTRIMNRLQPKWTALARPGGPGRGSDPVHHLRGPHRLLPAHLRGRAAGRPGGGDRVHPAVDHGGGERPGQGRRDRLGNRQRLPAGGGGAVGGRAGRGVHQPHATLLAHGRSAIDALDGGYRLAFTIALSSVLVGIVVGLVILKSAPRPSTRGRRRLRGGGRDDDRRGALTAASYGRPVPSAAPARP